MKAKELSLAAMLKAGRLKFRELVVKRRRTNADACLKAKHECLHLMLHDDAN